MDPDTTIDSFSVSLFTRCPSWSERFAQAAKAAGVDLACHADARINAWPPSSGEPCELVLLDHGTVDCSRVSISGPLDKGGPAIVWIGSPDRVPDLPQELRSWVLDWIDGEPPVDTLAQKIRYWRRVATAPAQLAHAQAQLKEATVQNGLLAGKLKRLEEWIDVLNRQRMSMGNVMEKFTMLSRLGQQINTLDVDRITQTCVEKIPLLIDARYASLYLYEPETDELVLAHDNHDAEITKRVSLPEATGSMMATVVERKQALLVKEFASFERTHDLELARPNHDRYKSNSCIVVPLLSADRLVGVLNFTDKTTANFFDELNDLPTVEHLSHLIGAAIRNCQLYEEVRRQARRDSMTGFLNHRTFLEELEQEILRCERYGEEPSVVMIDCDKFKSINDTYGHQAGDQVIRDVASIIEANVRRVDKPCRYGGDEFAVVLAKSDEQTARTVAERIMQANRQHHVVHEDMDVQITLSIGVAHYAAGRTINELVHAADEALYDAKQAGRDRIAFRRLTPAADGAPDGVHCAT